MSTDSPALDPIRVFALVFAAATAFALTSRYPGYVHHDTAEIAMWSTLGWPVGLPKHPPLLPWLFRAYSYVVPLNWVTLGVLTAANITLGAWAVWRIAVMTIGERRAGLALMLYGLAPAGTFFALKLNHNAILVSLWPLTILAFLTCLWAETMRRSVVTGVAFGSVAAVAVLAKYYSGVLLASCVVAALVSPHRNRFLWQPGGYVAVGVFAVLIAPHAFWLWDHSAATLGYAFHESEREAHPLAHFLAVAPTYILPSIVTFLLLQRWMGVTATGAPPQLAGVRMAGAHVELWVLALGPYLLTAVFIAVFKLRGATSWSLPDFCMAPVVMAGMLPVPTQAQLSRLTKLTVAGLCAIALAGPAVLLASFKLNDANATEPRVEFARAGERLFKLATGRQPALVAGDPQSANTAALELASHPLAFTNFDRANAPWATLDLIDRAGVLVICRPGYGGCTDAAARLATGRTAFVCRLTMNRTLLGLTGRPYSAEVTVIAPVVTVSTATPAAREKAAAGFQALCNAVR